MAEPANQGTWYERYKGYVSEAVFWIVAVSTIGGAVTFLLAYARPGSATVIIGVMVVPILIMIGMYLSLRSSIPKRIGRAVSNAMTERDRVLSDVLRVEAYCDPARGHGMFYSNKGVVIHFGIRVTNTGRRVVRPTEAGNMQLIPRWNTQVALSSSEKSKRLREAQSIGYQESTDIGDFEVVAGQWNWLSPPPGGVFAMFEVSGTLLIDTGSKDDEAMTFGCDNLALPVTGSPESPCQLPDAALARVADVPSGSKLRVASESGNQSVTESESESEADAGEGGKRARESGK